MPAVALTVLNADTATFDCSFGRGCSGLCCQNGRPSVSAAEQAKIKAVLPRVLPHLRPEAAKLVTKSGYLSARKKLGKPMVRVAGGWCVFFNGGCVLHKVGLEDGDFAMHKPIQCVLFPLEPAGDGTWYVRQWKYEGEGWDLFCLNPKNTKRKAAEALAPEIAVAAALPATFAWTDGATTETRRRQKPAPGRATKGGKKRRAS